MTDASDYTYESLRYIGTKLQKELDTFNHARVRGVAARQATIASAKRLLRISHCVAAALPGHIANLESRNA